MPLEKNTSAKKNGQLELDLDSLNLDMVSERYRARLAELQAWFKLTDNALEIESDYEPSNGPVTGSYK